MVKAPCALSSTQNVQALVVLEFLLLRGSPQCLQITVEDVLPKLTELSSFAFTNPEGKDQGVNVRYRYTNPFCLQFPRPRRDS